MQCNPKMFIQWMKHCSIKLGKVRSEEGFTLVEVIIALVVVSIISSSLVLPFLSSLNEGTKADIYTNAAHIASMDIDSWRAGSFSAIPLSTGTTGTNIVINGRAYVRTYNNTLIGTDYKQVFATVSSTPGVSVTLYGLISTDYK